MTCPDQDLTTKHSKNTLVKTKPLSKVACLFCSTFRPQQNEGIKNLNRKRDITKKLTKLEENNTFYSKKWKGKYKQRIKNVNIKKR